MLVCFWVFVCIKFHLFYLISGMVSWAGQALSWRLIHGLIYTYQYLIIKVRCQ
jgi:hypothetical protein